MFISTKKRLNCPLFEILMLMIFLLNLITPLYQCFHERDMIHMSIQSTISHQIITSTTIAYTKTTYTKPVMKTKKKLQRIITMEKMDKKLYKICIKQHSTFIKFDPNIFFLFLCVCVCFVYRVLFFACQLSIMKFNSLMHYGIF